MGFVFVLLCLLQLSSPQCPQSFDRKSTPWRYRCSLVISAVLDAFDWQLLGGLMLASLLLLAFPFTYCGTKVFFHLPHCTPRSNPGFLHISSEVILLSWLPLRICHPALLGVALLSIEQTPSELGGNCIQRVFLSQHVICCSPALRFAPAHAGARVCLHALGI